MMQSPLLATRNQFVADVSAADFSDQMGYVAGTGNLTIQFFYDRVRVDDPQNPEAHGDYKTVLCVRKRPHGDRLTESVRMISERAAQQLYPREYAFFKQNQDVPTDGTPLHELPGISQSQIAILVIHGIRCVEDLCGLSADQVGQIGMDARTAYSIAKKWMESKEGGADVIAAAQRDAALTAELERLRADKQRQDSLIAELSAKLDIVTKLQGNVMQAAPQTMTAAGAVQQIDADDLPDLSGDETLFSGAQIVTGNDDLDGDVAPSPSLPGLDRKKR